MKKKAQNPKKKKNKISIDQCWELINPHAAGINIGSREHYVCVPAGRAEKNVRRFGTFTSELEVLAEWLKECGVSTVAMESTGDLSRTTEELRQGSKESARKGLFLCRCTLRQRSVIPLAV